MKNSAKKNESVFKDERGTITNVLSDMPIKHIALITSKANTIV